MAVVELISDPLAGVKAYKSTNMIGRTSLWCNYSMIKETDQSKVSNLRGPLDNATCLSMRTLANFISKEKIFIWCKILFEASPTDWNHSYNFNH